MGGPSGAILAAVNPAYFVAIALQCANPDVLVLASADAPFAAQSGFGAQVLGKYPPAKAIPEEGIHGAPLPGGDTLRLGKLPDPLDPGRKAFAFQLAPDDPKTSGSKRSEFAFAKNIEHGKVYWAAVSVYVYDWSKDFGHDERSTVGIQLHGGDNSLRLGPVFAVNTAGPRHLQVVIRAGSGGRSQRTLRASEQRIPFERWFDLVFKFRLSTGDDGFLHAWMDGKRIAEHEGPLGYPSPGFKDYLKIGYYNWSRFDSPRKVLVRSPMVLVDPTGEKYKPDDLRALTKARCS
jgi:hypothetical protein